MGEFKDDKIKIQREIYISQYIPQAIKGVYKCVKCGNDNINVEYKQMRSADEGTTAFFKCVKCGNEWVRS